MHRFRRFSIRFRFLLLILINLGLLTSFLGYLYVNYRSEADFEASMDFVYRFFGPSRNGSILLFTIFLGLLILSIFYVIYFIRSIIFPLNTLQKKFTLLKHFDNIPQLQLEGSDEITLLAQSLNSTYECFSTTLSSLKQKIAQQEVALNQRQAYLQAVVELARGSTSITDIDDFLEQAVDLIKDHFNLYFVGLYLLDSTGERASICAGTGNAGKLMLEKNHRVKAGEVGLIGSVLASGIARVVNDVEKDFAFHVSPFLGETGSEAVFPIKSGNEMIGVLDAHSNRTGHFENGTFAILQIIVDQLGVAMTNASQGTDQNVSLAPKSSLPHDHQSQWVLSQLSRLVDEQELDSTDITYSEVPPPVHVLEELKKGRPAIDHKEDGEEKTIFYMPLKTSNKVIGYIGLVDPTLGNEATDENAVEALGAISNQVTLALDARANRETILSQIEREKLVAELGAKLYDSLDVDTVVKVGVKNIQQILNLQDVTIVLQEDLVGSTENMHEKGT